VALRFLPRAQPALIAGYAVWVDGRFASACVWGKDERLRRTKLRGLNVWLAA